MSNVTLDVFWIDFMPIYHHVIGKYSIPYLFTFYQQNIEYVLPKKMKEGVKLC